MQKPNIVLIYADDIGWGDLSCYGAKTIATPHSDRLAAQGLRFTNGYCTASTCTPSRYSLLSGEYAFRKKGTGILQGDAALIIEPGRQTLPSMLKGSGYNTAVVGKWHLGLGGEGGPDWNGVIAPGPLEIGFNQSFIFPATADRVPTVYIEDHRVVNLDPNDPIHVSYQGPIDDGPTGAKNPEIVRLKPTNAQHNNSIINGIPRIGYMSGGKAALWKDEDLAKTFTARAVDFLQKQSKDKPFFLYFPTHNNHSPRAPDPRFVGKTPHGPRGDAVIEFDWMVGEILDTLDRLKFTDNTLVILSSDNGPVVIDGYYDGAERLLGDHKPAGPFRGGKYSAFEGGTKIPFIVRWPGHIAPGISEAMISQVDLLASLAALTGQTVSAQSAPDSQNQLPTMLGQDKVGRNEMVELGLGNRFGLRVGKWKLIAKENEKPQLYDLSTDIAESENLAEQKPEQLQRMRTRLQEILSAHQATK